MSKRKVIENKQTLGSEKVDFTFQRKTTKDILEICKPLFDTFNITLFSQTRAFHDGSFTSLMTNTDLSEYYIQKKYPIYFSQGNGVFLQEGHYLLSHANNPLHANKFRELHERFNLGNMLLIVEKGKDYDDVYTFATVPENTQIINQYINNRDLLKRFLLYYKDKSYKLIQKAELIKYGQEYYITDTANGIEFVADIPNREEFLNKLALKKVHIIGKQGRATLSAREFDCLKYIIKDYTLKEIAKILSLSPRTVETYVNNLKHKLGCDKRSELIELVNEQELF